MRSFAKAFTMIEILVVLGIISSITLFSYLNVPVQIKKAFDARRKGDLYKIRGAIEDYYEDTNCYPIALPVCGNSFEEDGLTLLAKIPCDPRTRLSYVYVAEGDDCPSWFQLYGNLEYLQDKIIDKVGCRSGCGPDCQFNFGTSSSNQKLNPYCQAAGSFPSADPSSPVPTAEPSPEINPEQYVCAPGGDCEIYADPEISGCPDIYPNDPTCQDQCAEKKNRCHDARGKW